MFLRAGHTRFRVVCRAFIGRQGWRHGTRASTLVRFIPYGEYAWTGRGGATWPQHVFVMCWRAVVPSALQDGSLRLEASRLPE